QSFRRDNHFLLASTDVHLTIGADFPDVAGMEPAVCERARGFSFGLEVSARDVVAAHQNLAVVGDLHVDAGDRSADRSFFRAERMIQADDWRRFREAVTLHDDEAELFPE